MKIINIICLILLFILVNGRAKLSYEIVLLEKEIVEQYLLNIFYFYNKTLFNNFFSFSRRTYFCLNKRLAS